MTTVRSLVSLLAVLLSWLVYYRGREVYSFYSNAPERLPHYQRFERHSIELADRVRSCEDALILESRGVAILACDPGRERWNTVMGVFLPGPVTSASLYVYDYKDPDAASPLRQVEIIDFLGSADFHTLGMAYDEATSTLFASNHAQAGPRIETFRLDLDKLTATHMGTLEHPLIHGPNSIAIINSQEIYVTNDKFFLARYTKVLSKLETVLAFPLGSVVHVKLSDRDGGAFHVEKAHRVARAAFANGIELLNSTTVALAATTKSSIYLYDMNADRTLTFKSSFRLPFMPDNLSVHGNRLLIAGHPHFPSLAKYTVTRHVCNDPAELVKASAELREYCQNGKATSWVAEWTEKGGLQNIYIGTEYPTSATAAWDSTRGVGIISGLYAKGLLVWRDSPEH